MTLTDTEQIIISKLSSALNINHIPVYRNGELIKISGISDEHIYEERQYAYSAKIFISDEVIYNLDNIKSIKSLEIPQFIKNGDLNFTTDLSYILKMQACSEKRDSFVVPMILKVFNLMKASPINWLRRDYMQLVEQLWKSGKIIQADELEKTVNKRFGIFDNYQIYKHKFKSTLKTAEEMGTDLLVSSSHTDTCEECSILQNRIYSISGKSKKYPALPKQVFKYGNFHQGCRHSFYPFIDGVSIFTIQKDGSLINVDPVEYSNRPYIDTRTAEEIERYKKYCSKKKNDIDFENLKREYYHKKYEDYTSVPKTFSLYIKENGFKRIT